MSPDATRATTSSSEWWLEEPEPVQPSDYDETLGELSASVLVDALGDLRSAVGETDTTLAEAVRWYDEKLDTQSLVDIVGVVQDLRRRLGVVEAFVTRAAFTSAQWTGAKDGALSDGRPYQIKRGAARKAWDHEGWQIAVRRKIVGDTPELVNPSTGETVDPYDLISRAQKVHGSTAPKVTALRELEVDPGDFCHTGKGNLSVIITTSTTTPKDQP